MEGCGGDDSGVMRDLLQNHLLQRLYLNAIEGNGTRFVRRDETEATHRPAVPATQRALSANHLTAARLLRALHLVIPGTGKREIRQQPMASADPRRHSIATILHVPHAQLRLHWSP